MHLDSVVRNALILTFLRPQQFSLSLKADKFLPLSSSVRPNLSFYFCPPSFFSNSFLVLFALSLPLFLFIAAVEEADIEAVPQKKGEKGLKGGKGGTGGKGGKGGEEDDMSPVLRSVSEHSRGLLGALCCECLVHGNVSAERTVAFADRIKQIIRTYSNMERTDDKEVGSGMDGTEVKGKKGGKGGKQEKGEEGKKAEKKGGLSALSDAHNPSQQVVLLPLDRVVLVRAVPKNPNENNKCVEVYYQLGERASPNHSCPPHCHPFKCVTL